MPVNREDPKALDIQAIWDSQKHIVTDEDKSNHHLSNTFFNAWRHDAFENYLYAVYSLPTLHSALVTEYRFPHATLVPMPQALFHPYENVSLDDRPILEVPTTRTTKIFPSSVLPDNATPLIQPVVDVVQQVPLVSFSVENARPSSPGPVRSTISTSSGALQVGDLQDETPTVPVNVDVESSVVVVTQAHSADRNNTAAQPFPTVVDAESTGKSPNDVVTPEARAPAERGTDGGREGKGTLHQTVTLDKKCTPDFARILVSNKAPFALTPPEEDLLVDFWEIKRLSVDSLWQTEIGRLAAYRAIEANVEQVYEQAMAAFAHNPSWTTVVALLIIGCYFSQFEWTRELPKQQDAGAVPASRPPVTPQPNGPPPPIRPLDPSLASHISSTNALELIERQENRLAELAKRMKPTVYYFNELAIDIMPDNTYGARCAWSPKFIEAVVSPLRTERLAQHLVVQPSWFDFEAKREIHKEGTDRVKEWLKEKEVELTQPLRDWLAGKKNEEADRQARIPPTPATDPTDKDYHGRKPAHVGNRDTTPTPTGGTRVGQRVRLQVELPVSYVPSEQLKKRNERRQKIRAEEEKTRRVAAYREAALDLYGTIVHDAHNESGGGEGSEAAAS